MLKKFRINSALMLALLAICSCASGNKNDAPSEIRIVDLNGNPKPVKRYTPEGNAQILAGQGMGQANNIAPQNTLQNSPQNAPQNTSPEPTANNAVVDQNLADTTEPSAPATQTPSAAAAQVENQIANNAVEENISYDMSGTEATEIKPENTNAAPNKTTGGKKFKFTAGEGSNTNVVYKATKISSKKSANAKGEDTNGIFIQIGSFSIQENADKTLQASKKISKGKIEEADLANNKSYRVLLGPIANKQKAHNILKKAKNAGYKDAFIVR